MKVIIILTILFAAVFCNTRDEEFEKLYQVKHLADGDGVSFPKAGNTVTVHYTGTFVDGRKFDSSLDRRQPFSFTLKRGQVIACWDEVVGRMTKGEKIYVICPSKFAYGERGAGGVIPPNTDIAFEIELLSYTGSEEL